MIRKNLLKKAGFDISILTDEQKVNAAFKKAGLKFPKSNNMGIA
tara:strand:- start:714 stop:845 length:132 start_codon:yes stop_codon:yes gene_type:complete